MLLKQFSLTAISVLFLLSAQAQDTTFHFDFGDGPVAKGYTKVTASTVYAKEKGYGFMPGASVVNVNRNGKNLLQTDFLTSDKPFYFSVDVPDGNYEVTVLLGDEKGTSSQTVRAECRRLMLHDIQTPNGKVVAKEFTVHKRSLPINGSENVLIKDREKNFLHWDNQLTLEFNGPSPKICGLTIQKTTAPITVFLAGNSTVVDQDREPWAAWGQMIPAFFEPGKVSIANYAESGETLKAFEHEKRLAKVWSMAKAGDYLFIEFAHNDQKPGENHLDPFTTYKQTVKEWIAEARKRGITPVLVTSMNRRTFDSAGHITNSLGDYPEAMRQTAKEEKVACIDLNAMSKVLYEAWGPKESIHAFVHYPPNTFPGQERELKDDTHFNPYGAYELARCIAAGITEQKLGIAKYLFPQFTTFNPAKPDDRTSFVWPLSPRVTALKPDGN
jgi:lysophospholipase L1-like esterase